VRRGRSLLLEPEPLPPDGELRELALEDMACDEVVGL
jgi:hypothetical protein